MDIYLTAAADALVRQNMKSTFQPSDEEAYYARSTVTVIYPAWLLRLLAMMRNRARHNRHAEHRAPVAHHA